jgi:Flp pilus assembly pilin Flp
MLLRLITSAKIQLGLLRSRVEEDFGATAVEYALMLAFIAAVVIAGVTLLGQGTDAGFKTVTFPP